MLRQSRKPMQVWTDYNGAEMLVNVTLAPLSHLKPSKSLLPKQINLSLVLLESIYVGFSASTGLISNSQYLLGWSWNQSGQAQGLDPAKLPPLEVSCGRRPIDEQAASGDFFLVDGVYCCWKRGPILEAGDPQLKRSYDNEEMQLILKLGLLCEHPKAEERPTMRQVVSFLDRDAIIPDIPSDFDPEIKGFLMEGSGTSSYMLPLSSGSVSLGPYPNVNSILQFGL